MTTNRITNAAVNGSRCVTYYRKIHEVTTEDGMNLIMTQKLPVDSKPKGFVMLVHGLGGSISYCIGSEFQDKLAGIISIGGPFNMARGNRLLKSIAHIGITLGKINPFPKIQPDVFYIDYIGILVSMGLVGLMDHKWNRIPLQIWYPESIEEDILHERITKGFDRTSFNVIKFFFKWGAKGKFCSSDGQIDFEDHISKLHIPILFVNGEQDYGVPESAIREAFEKAGSDDKIFKTFGMENSGHHWGHCDLICGKHAPEVTWPYILNWLEERI
jgi:pimeloyl-ACP methyl ester carboxylesterase